MALASTLAVVRASEPCSSGSDTSTALAAPMASAVRRPDDLAVGRHRHQADLAAAGRVDELQRHLDAVAVRLVEDELALALQGVGGRIQRARRGRDPGSASRRRRRSWPVIVTDRSPAGPDSRRPIRPIGLAGPGGTVDRLVRLLLVVNSFASSVTARNTVVVHQVLSQEPRRADRRDQPPGPRHPLRPGRGQPGRRRRRRLRRRRHAQRGRGRHRRHAHRAGRAARAARPTCSPAASACPTTPIAAAQAARPRAQGAATSAGSASAWSTAATSASTPASASTPPSSGRSRSGPRSSGGWATRSSSTPRCAPGSRSYDRRHPHFAVGAARRGHPRARRLLHRRAQHQPVHLPRQPPTRPVARTPRSTAGWWRSRSAACGPCRSWARWPGRCGAGPSRPTTPSTSTTTWPTLASSRPRPFPYQVDGDYLGETRRLRFQHRPEVMDLRASPARRPLTAQRPAARHRDVGDVGADAVDAPCRPGGPWRRVVARPDVDGQAGPVAALDQGAGRRPATTGAAPGGRRPPAPRPRRPGARSTSQAVAMRRIGHGSQAVDARPVERRHEHPVGLAPGADEGGDVVGQRRGRHRSPGSAGSFLISMLTAMPAQASSAASSVGTWSGRSPAATRATARPSARCGVVVDDEPAVGAPADVELDHVGAHLRGPPEGGHRVLRARPATPLGGR